MFEVPCGIGLWWGGREGSQEVRMWSEGLQLTHLCYHVWYKTVKITMILNLKLSFQIIMKICFICQGRLTEHILLNNVSLVYNFYLFRHMLCRTFFALFPWTSHVRDRFGWHTHIVAIQYIISWINIMNCCFHFRLIFLSLSLNVITLTSPIHLFQSNSCH